MIKDKLTMPPTHTMSMTGGISIGKKSLSWSNLKAHNTRKTKHHSNKRINNSYSKFNYYSEISLKKLTKEFVTNTEKRTHFLSSRNNKYKNRGQYKYIKSVDDVVNNALKKHNNERCCILQIGNFSNQQKLWKKIKAEYPTKKQRFNAINHAFISAINKFNNKNFSMKKGGFIITGVDIHNDEINPVTKLPNIHAHVRLNSFNLKTIPAHHTKSGRYKSAKTKLNFGFDRAIKHYYNSKNNRIALQNFKKLNDKNLFNKFSQELIPTIKLKVHRKHGITRLSTRQHAIIAHNEAISQQKQKRNRSIEIRQNHMIKLQKLKLKILKTRLQKAKMEAQQVKYDTSFKGMIHSIFHNGFKTKKSSLEKLKEINTNRIKIGKSPLKASKFTILSINTLHAVHGFTHRKLERKHENEQAKKIKKEFNSYANKVGKELDKINKRSQTNNNYNHNNQSNVAHAPRIKPITPTINRHINNNGPDLS